MLVAWIATGQLRHHSSTLAQRSMLGLTCHQQRGGSSSSSSYNSMLAVQLAVRRQIDDALVALVAHALRTVTLGPDQLERPEQNACSSTVLP